MVKYPNTFDGPNTQNLTASLTNLTGVAVGFIPTYPLHPMFMVSRRRRCSLLSTPPPLPPPPPSPANLHLCYWGKEAACRSVPLPCMCVASAKAKPNASDAAPSGLVPHSALCRSTLPCHPPFHSPT